ncbi:TetR/AcrR family transcriptional regulator [Spirochaeta dissipatitropha]
MQKKRLNREEQKKQTRADLIAAATRSFPEHGFHGTSIDKIVEVAGYTKGAFYAHFADKEEIFLRVIMQQNNETMHETQQALAAGAGFDEILRGYQDEYRRNPPELRTWILLKVEFFLHAARTEHLHDTVRKFFRDTLHGITRMIEQAYASSKQTPRYSIETAAQLFMALDTGFALHFLIDPESAPVGDLESIFHSVFLQD